MTTEEDFEIDIYGDANGDQNNGGQDEGGDENNQNANGQGQGHDYDDQSHQQDGQGDQSQSSTNPTKQPSAPSQGVKRKGGSDDRPIDPGATTAIMVSELSWWITDDDVRGWIAAVKCEEELKDITFSEHKVNGKSKGQAYIEFTSQQAATATKHQVESQATGEYQAGQKKHSVIYSSPTANPFRTLPKEAPGRGARDTQNRNTSGSGYQDRSSGNYNNNNNNYGGNNNSGYRGRGGGNMYNNSRGGGGGMGNPGFNRNFSGGNMNAFNANANNNNNNPMNFGNPMGGGGFVGGGGNFRGNMGGGMRGGQGMRGGRGGPMGGMMGGMGPGMGGMGGMNPMGNMPGAMGGMGGMGGMGMVGGGMPNFPVMHPNFTPNFFGGGGGGGGGGIGGGGGGNQGGGDWQNPHGTKRQRPE